MGRGARGNVRLLTLAPLHIPFVAEIQPLLGPYELARQNASPVAKDIMQLLTNTPNMKPSEVTQTLATSYTRDQVSDGLWELIDNSLIQLSSKRRLSVH